MTTRLARRLPRRPRYARVARRLPRNLGRFMMRKRLLRKFPTFTETFSYNVGPPNAPIVANVGGVLQVKIDDMSANQYQSYSTLYRQYRINWVKFIIVPDWNSYDPNAALVVANNVSQPRIAWSVDDTPGLVAPANEDDLLEDNGCKVRSLSTKWSQSCKPVPQQATGVAGGVLMRYGKAPFLSFTPGFNPLHFGVRYFITQNIAAGPPTVFKCIVKMNFSLRDPQ